LPKKTKAQRAWEKSAGNLGGNDKDDHDRFIRDEMDRIRDTHDLSDDRDLDENNQTYINIGGNKYYFG